MSSRTVKDVSADVLVKQGFAYQQAGDLLLAKVSYEQAIKQDPQNLEALQLLGILYALNNSYDQAIQLLNRAHKANPLNPYVLFNRANILCSIGAHEQSLADLKIALSLQPDNLEGLLTKANNLEVLKYFDLALECLDKAIAINPQLAKAFNNRGVVLKSLGRTNDALNSFAEAISINPQYADAFNNLGILLLSIGNCEQAILSFDAAISLQPRLAAAYNNRGNALNLLKRNEEALINFDIALNLRTDYAEAYSNRGNSLKGLMRFDEAMASYEKAISINSNYSEAYNSRAILNREQGNLTEAFNDLIKAMEINPNYFDARGNFGAVLSEMGKFNQAFECFEKLTDGKLSNSQVNWNMGLLYLLVGDYKKGWPLYEYRCKKGVNDLNREFEEPTWLGKESLHGKRILIYVEQGLGDAIQFARYLKLVKKAGAYVLFGVFLQLMQLFKDLDGVDELVEDGMPLPKFDYQCALMSLPLIFKTELTSIPSPTKYLRADISKKQYWAQKIQDKKRLKVGIVWNGGFRPKKPENWGVNERRNIPLGIFAGKLQSSNVCFYSLQKGDPAESEIRGHELQFWPNGNFINYVDELQDFTDTAALIENLDLVISVDTSTAHLAAALGKPAWILIRYDTCWRWLLDREDSPWYESVKLYRQGEDRDWCAPLERVAKDLEKLRLVKFSNSVTV